MDHMMHSRNVEGKHFSDKYDSPLGNFASGGRAEIAQSPLHTIYLYIHTFLIAFSGAYA